MTKRIWIGALLMAFVALTMTAHARWATRAGAGDAPGEMAPNEFGVAESVHRSGLIDRSNPFFREAECRAPPNGRCARHSRHGAELQVVGHRSLHHLIYRDRPGGRRRLSKGNPSPREQAG